MYTAAGRYGEGVLLGHRPMGARAGMSSPMDHNWRVGAEAPLPVVGVTQLAGVLRHFDVKDGSAVIVCVMREGAHAGQPTSDPPRANHVG